MDKTFKYGVKRNSTLRMEASEQLGARLGLGSGEADIALANLFGFERYSDLMDGTTDAIREKLIALTGPNGFTVYKMLLARKGR